MPATVPARRRWRSSTRRSSKKYFAGDNPLGARIKLSRAEDASKPWLTIIGVAGDVKTTTVFQEMGYIEPPVVYRPLAQSAPGSLAVMLAVHGSPLALVSEVQQDLTAVDPNLILGDIDGLRARQAAVLSQPRFRSVLFSGFAVLALLLSLVGLYGVLAQAVMRRRRDIGIRMAMGATRNRVLRSVLGQACAMTTAGIAIGAVLAVAGIRVLRGMLYGIGAQGVGELTLVAIVLLIGAVAAAWAPAYRGRIGRSDARPAGRISPSGLYFPHNGMAGPVETAGSDVAALPSALYEAFTGAASSDGLGEVE